jgi:hypothetical protein
LQIHILQRKKFLLKKIASKKIKRIQVAENDKFSHGEGKLNNCNKVEIEGLVLTKTNEIKKNVFKLYNDK